MNVLGLSLLPTEVTVLGLVPQRLLTQACSYGSCCLETARTYVPVLSVFPQRSLPGPGPGPVEVAVLDMLP